jgi:hypothetical protein
MLTDASSDWSTVTTDDNQSSGRKRHDFVLDFFGNYLGISALLTAESDYNVDVSRFAALHGEEKYSGQGCNKETSEKAGGEEGAGEEDRCQEGSGEEAGCQEGSGEEGSRQEGAGQEKVIRKGAG